MSAESCCECGEPLLSPSVAVEGCFLCATDPALVYYHDADHVALCGLGPIGDGYSVVGTRDHLRSAADAHEAFPGSLVAFAEEVRDKLIQRFGSCLVTEHGRMPVCTHVKEGAHAHCFHAHFLLFPGAPEVDYVARMSFEDVEEYPNISEALADAVRQDEYFLLSPEPSRAYVMTRQIEKRRQFARHLVAHVAGSPDLADWEGNPRYEQASNQAARLRRVFHGDGGYEQDR